MSTTRDLLTGLQALLTEATRVTVTVGPIPWDAPDQRCAIQYTSGPTDPEGRWEQGVLMLQTRGATGVPLDADDIADPLKDVLIRIHGLVLGSVSVSDCQHRGASRGLDSSRRSVRADRFDLYLDYPQ